MISAYCKQIQTGSSPVETIQKFFEQAKKLASNNYFTVLLEEQALERAKEIEKKALTTKLPLAGLPFTVKDCICVKDVETTACSDILRGYKPLMTATAVQRMIRAGAILVGKTVQDEFGFGGLGVTPGKNFLIPKNPLDPSRVCGGSSSGSGGITRAINVPHVSLGESTGGSIVNPASFCNVVGLCPTYGRVSRYGLLDYGNSLDKIGPLAKSVEDAATILHIIAGHDSLDETTSKESPPLFSNVKKGLRVARIREAFGEGVDEKEKNKVHEYLTQLEKQGVSIREVSLPYNDKYAIPVYYILALSEASTNLARYSGMRYGQQPPLKESYNEFFTRVRTQHFGKEAKRRILIGTFARMAGYRDEFYNKALRVRTKLIQEYHAVFKSCDVLISPTMPVQPPKIKETGQLSLLQTYMMDKLTVGPNLAGLPHMNIPDNVLLIANHFQETNLYRGGSNAT